VGMGHLSAGRRALYILRGGEVHEVRPLQQVPYTRIRSEHIRTIWTSSSPSPVALHKEVWSAGNAGSATHSLRQKRSLRVTPVLIAKLETQGLRCDLSEAEMSH
jgi:hypothetical protein